MPQAEATHLDLPHVVLAVPDPGHRPDFTIFASHRISIGDRLAMIASD